MALFCPEHSNCEAPISFITDILTNKDPLKFEEISNEFKLLGFDKVKDLANSSFGKVGKINCLGEDPLAKLYQAIEIYDQYCANQLKSAKLEYSQKNFNKTREICQEMLTHKPYDIEFLILLSGSYFCCKDYDTCITYLKEAYNKNPNCTEISNNLGLCYYSNSQYTEAFKFFSDALHKDISNADAWINCARILILADKKHEAVIAFQMILSLKPDLYIVHNEYAQLLLSLNRIQEAELQYKIATKKAPEYVDTWNNLGDLYYNTDKIEEAIICYKKASELNRNLTITWNKLGIAYLKLNKFEDALDSFKESLKLCPQDICALKNTALAYARQSKWPSAVCTYARVLGFQPNDLDSNLQLGLIYYNFLANFEEAAKYFKKLVCSNPLEEDFHRYLIGVYLTMGKNKCACEAAISFGDIHFDRDNYESAKKAYSWAISIYPENEIGHWKLGNTMYRLGCIDSALSRYKICLELKPNFANAYSDCGLLYEETNFPEKALNYYDTAHALDPNNLIVLQNLTYLNEKLGNLNDAIKLNYKILKHKDSDDFRVHLDLAKCHKKIGNLNDALNHCGVALRLIMTDTEIIDVSQFLGSILLAMNKKEEALLFFNKAIELNPQCVKAYTNIGSIYQDCDNFIEAIHSYNIALDIIPNFPDAYCNLVQCLQHICDWSDYDERISKLKEIVIKQLNDDQVPSILPRYWLLYNFSLDTLKKIASKYAEQIIEKANLIKKGNKGCLNEKYIYNGLIRVGYVSSDFGKRSIAQLMLSISNFHNKNRIEVFCYSLSPKDDSSSWSKFFTESDHFKDISELKIFDAATLIKNDGIHILVNMNGYTKWATNEIFALRPAPIQVSWLGYSSTSGATFIDYLITDHICSPSKFGEFYTEKLAYMNCSVSVGYHKQIYNDLNCHIYRNPGTKENISLNSENNIKDCHFNELVSNINTNFMFCIKFSDDNFKCLTRQIYNLPEDVIVYCNFSQLFKIEPSTFQMWANILHNVPNSVLWLLRSTCNGEQNLKKYAATLNIDVSRIIFSNVEKEENHLLRIQLADIYLDTPLYNANMTCLDVLWAGIPVITLPGNTLASRVATSQLTTFGCPETIAQSEEDYVQKAINYGSNKIALDSLKFKISSIKKESKLFDCKSYTEELENIYYAIWGNFLSESI